MDKILIGTIALLFGVGTLLFSRRAEANMVIEKGDELEPIVVPDLYDYRGRNDLPRGVRNNNPGNIEDVGINWQGLSGNDGRYGIFINTVYGIRAMMIDIHTGFVRDHENTVRAIIKEWAPSVENPTAEYIQFVASFMNVSPDQPLDFKAHVIPLSKAIAQHENGLKPDGTRYKVPYPHSLYVEALKLSGK